MKRKEENRNGWIEERRETKERTSSQKKARTNEIKTRGTKERKEGRGEGRVTKRKSPARFKRCSWKLLFLRSDLLKDVLIVFLATRT